MIYKLINDMECNNYKEKIEEGIDLLITTSAEFVVQNFEESEQPVAWMEMLCNTLTKMCAEAGIDFDVTIQNVYTAYKERCK